MHGVGGTLIYFTCLTKPFFFFFFFYSLCVVRDWPVNWEKGLVTVLRIRYLVRNKSCFTIDSINYLLFSFSFFFFFSYLYMKLIKSLVSCEKTEVLKNKG